MDFANAKYFEPKNGNSVMLVYLTETDKESIADRVYARIAPRLDAIESVLQDRATDSGKQWLTKKEVCKFLDISERTLTRRIEDGNFPSGYAIRGSKDRRWRLSDINLALMQMEG